MILYEFHIVYPEGESREIKNCLNLSDILDINGNPLELPLPTNRMIAYQISKKRTIENKGIVTTVYYLEQLNSDELQSYL
ncbi:MAG TPA: hypothetical protein VJ861_06780 [Treponemataceae bacterium]|nr:hypothetical protein [Treponemataceae bacterium]